VIAAQLEGAHLGGAHLQGADLSGAHLQGAVLDGAHLEGADLGASIVTGEASGLTPGQLELAHSDESTELPSYLQEAALKANPDPR
jgi:hypothetical protein